jgi:hypothetical protein
MSRKLAGTATQANKKGFRLDENLLYSFWLSWSGFNNYSNFEVLEALRLCHSDNASNSVLRWS